MRRITICHGSAANGVPRQFAYPHFSLAQGGAEEGSASSASRFNALFTGSVDFSRFSDGGDDSDSDGTSTTYRLGLDVLPNPEVPLVTGLQLAFTRAHADFHVVEIDTEGTYGVNLFTVHPSVAWGATENLTLWASIGYGRGETELTIDAIADDFFDFVEGTSSTSTGDFFSVAAGAGLRVWQSDASALTLKVDGATASFLDTDAQQGRLPAQFSRDFALNSGRLKSTTDLALLLSNSDPGVMELSGSLNWLPDAGRLSGAPPPPGFSCLAVIAANGASAAASSCYPASREKASPWLCNPPSARPMLPLRGWRV